MLSLGVDVRVSSFTFTFIISFTVIFTFMVTITFTVIFTFRVFHRYLVGMLATRATVSFNFTSLLFTLSSPSPQYTCMYNILLQEYILEEYIQYTCMYYIL